jgi:4-amino-4-deoxy-L-arabinose transferase-like glycosyltransferase
MLLLLTLLGYALRAHNLDAFSFWTDEGLTPERAGYPVAQILRNDILIQGVVTKDTHPPLYYLILHVTRQLFGLSDFAFRYPSVLFGVLLIPLLYQLGRRLGNATIGLLAALLVAVNPLQVYYSQEARMYTLLVLLVTAMSYVLWRAIDQIRDTRYEIRNAGSSSVSRISYVVSPAGGLALYGLFAALALYTHYTVAFLIAVQALFWAWVLWRAGLKWVILGAIGLGVVAAIPLIPYTLPRLLAGAEANYYAVSPLTMLLDVVRFFNLGLTVDHSQRFVVALNVLAFGLLVLGVWASARYEIRNTKYDETSRDSYPVSRISYLVSRPAFLLSWLLAVVFGLMAGSILFKPMYQGVRHIMVGSPAFLLLVAFGLWAIWDWLPPRRRAPAPVDADELTGWAVWMAGAPRMNPLALIPLSLLLIGSLFALVNLYGDPAYVKDDFRAIVRFIETRAGNRDVIVYNNAVLLPLHEHYRLRDDITVTALPAYPQFATGDESQLAALARDYDRVWFITDPPADKRDEDRLIQTWLDANLTETINRLFPARTTEARVIAYSTRAGVTADARSPLSGIREWGSSLQLGGVSVRGPDPLSLPALWVDLFWQGEQPPVGEQLLFSLVGPDGKEVYRHGHALLRDGRQTWKATGLNRLSYDLPLPPGLPPGSYTLSVAPAGGELLPLVTVEIASTDTWPASPEDLFGDSELQAVARKRPAVIWPNGLSLTGVELWDDIVLPGNNLPLTLYWRVGPDGADLSDLRYRLEVIDGQGHVLRSQEDKPGASWLGQIAGGALLRENTGLYFRPEVEPGNYRLRWTLLDGDTPLGEPVISGRVRVEPWPLETEVPPAPYVVAADFGPAIRLHSYNMGVPTDGLLNLTFYWQALAEPDTGYTVFVHLVDESGAIVSQVDSVPVGGARPTTGWRAGEVITDVHNLPIPADLPPGVYRINVGLYNPDDGTRPPVTAGGAPQPDNQLQLDSSLVLPQEQP